MRGRCALCGKWAALERHHIYAGTRRDISERYGAVIFLCHNCHNEPPLGVHHDAEIRKQLQKNEQKRLMRLYHWSVEDFMSRFGKNYLED